MARFELRCAGNSSQSSARPTMTAQTRSSGTSFPWSSLSRRARASARRLTARLAPAATGGPSQCPAQQQSPRLSRSGDCISYKSAAFCRLAACLPPSGRCSIYQHAFGPHEAGPYRRHANRQCCFTWYCRHLVVQCIAHHCELLQAFSGSDRSACSKGACSKGTCSRDTRCATQQSRHSQRLKPERLRLSCAWRCQQLQSACLGQQAEGWQPATGR